MAEKNNLKVLAFDFGASSGRAILGILDQEKNLNLEVLYRFPNQGVQVGNSLYWNVLGLFEEIKNGLRLSAEKHGKEISSISLCFWGVDFALLDENDE